MILKTGEEVRGWFADVGNAVAFDTETNGLDYYTLVVDSLQFSNGVTSCFIEVNKDTVATLRVIFKGLRTLVGHNIVFDLKALKKLGMPYEHLRLYCTMVADHLIDENRSHALKSLAKDILCVEETITWEQANKIGGDTFVQYAINDALWTWQLCKWQQSRLKENGLAKLFREIEMPFQLCIVDMETTGILVDVQEIERLYKVLSKEIENVKIQMLDYLGERYSLQANLYTKDMRVVSRVDFDSPKQISDILFTRLGLGVIETTPSGTPSTGKLTLAHYAKTNEFVFLLSKYKIISKALNSYLSRDAQILRNVDDDGRVRASFNDCGTRTGRLSSSNPNLQQLSKPNKLYPINLRQCFVATPGYKMITCDYSGQEVRVMAEVSKDPILIESLIKGQDMHLKVANQFFKLGIPDECLYDTHPEFEAYKERFAKERGQAKAITFGIAYGKGAFGYAKDFNVSEDEAQKMIDKYFAGMQVLQQSITNTHNSLKRDGYVTSLTGRRRRFEKTKRDDWEGYIKKDLRQSFNFLIQGYSADMIRMAMVKVRNDVILKNPQWDVRTLATVHDEAVYEVKEQYAFLAMKAIKNAFESAVTLSVPVVSDVSVGDNYWESK